MIRACAASDPLAGADRPATRGTHARPVSQTRDQHGMPHAMSARERLALYPPIEPYRHGRLKVGDGHEIYYEECGNPHGKPVADRARRPRRRLQPHHAALPRSGALPHRAVRPARLRPLAAARQPRGQHDLGPGRRHGAAARAPRHRPLAAVRRLLGLDAGARLRRDASRARQRPDPARHLPAAPRGARSGSTRRAAAGCSPTPSRSSARSSRRRSAAT